MIAGFHFALMFWNGSTSELSHHHRPMSQTLHHSTLPIAMPSLHPRHQSEGGFQTLAPDLPTAKLDATLARVGPPIAALGLVATEKPPIFGMHDAINNPEHRPFFSFFFFYKSLPPAAVGVTGDHSFTSIHCMSHFGAYARVTRDGVGGGVACRV